VKLLFVTPQLPWPPTQGTALRNYRLLSAASEVHQVDLLSFADGVVPEALRSVCRRIEVVPPPRRTPTRRLIDLAAGWADMERRLWSPAFDRRLRQLVSEGAYDAVQLEGFEVAGYLLGPAALRREAYSNTMLPKVIFDDHNAEYELQASAARIDAAAARRWARAAYSGVQAARLRRREALYACAADACVAVSSEDAAALARIAPGVEPLVVGNGVDCSRPIERVPAPVPTILFTGKLDYRPNVDACEWLVGEIFPRVRAAVTGVRLMLAGRDPSPAVRALAGADVAVTGALSDAALTRCRSEAWVYAVPMRMGSGVRFKALEAMAAGVPLVSTVLGVSGTGAIDGTHALVSDDAAGFADHLTALLRDPPRGRDLAREARRLVEEVHDWRHITPRLLALYERLGAARGAEAPPVSVVATVLNERESAARLLASLGEQTRAPDEVVIVDGGSSDGTPDVLRAASRSRNLRLIEEPGANISAGRNRAIEAARHEVIVAADAGVELHPAWAERLAAALDGDSDRARAVSGFFVSAPASAWELALGATVLLDAAEIDPARFLPSSRSVAFTKAAWRAAGRYPEWLDYCEDLVFDFGLIAAGARPRFVPRAVVRFRPRSTAQAFFLQYYRYARGDGKADLWRRRHAVRYATYVAGAALAVRAARGDRASLASLALGGGAYLRRPLIRLSQQAPTLGAFLLAAPMVPLARLVGDVAKMAGYPVGVLWRRRHQAGDSEKESLSSPS
jgi:glycosyltransferase involved in cell wall biosynthesis